jgi:DNA-binding transcriptional LysR family regulator
LSQSMPDMLEEGHDVAILAAPDALPDSNFISHPLGVIDSVLCAAPRYVESHGKPRTVEALTEHVCLQVAQPNTPSDRWLLVGPEGEREFPLPANRFKVNQPDAMAVALHEGVGIGALPTLAARSSLRTGSLIRVLPDYQLQKLKVYGVYASRKYLDAKIRTWIDFARDWITNATRADDIRVTDGAGKPVERRLPRNGAHMREANLTDFRLHA